MSLYFYGTAEKSQCEAFVGHGATVSPLLSHRSKQALNVTVTGEGFPTLVLANVCWSASEQAFTAACVCGLSGQAEQMFLSLDKL